MRLATITIRKGISRLNIVTTGYGAQKAGCDRRKFKRWAKKLGIYPLGKLQEGAEPSIMDPEIFVREEADEVVAAILADRVRQRRA